MPLKAFLSSDHLTPATGKTIAITISKNGAAFGNPSAGATNATEIASGWYYVDLSTTDTGTVGPLVVLGTVAAVDPVDIAYDIAAFQAFPANFSSMAITAGGALTAGTVSDKTGYALTAAYDAAKTAAQAGNAMTLTSGERSSIAAAVWAYVVAGSATAVMAMRGFIAVLLGKVSGMDVELPAFRNIDDTKDVVVASTDATGNRLSVTLDLTP